jgi:DNA-binding response OmpR family regulator
MRLLIAEDDLALRRIIVKRLKAEGYAVDACADGSEALAFAHAAEYDGMILDIMLPQMDGLTLLRRIRSKGIRTGILLLTAKDSIEDRVMGLDAGADDYLIKPFAFEELFARIRTLIRRPGVADGAILQVDDLSLNTATHEVFRGPGPITLTAKEYALLEYLMYNAGHVLTRTQILSHVWSGDYGVESNVVDVYIRYLRNKIDRESPRKLVQTIRGYGYSLRQEEAQL